MVFRFWPTTTKTADSSETEQALTRHPGVLALIEDLVAAKRGTFLVGKDQLYVSGLKHPADALIVSRQVQLGLQGFRSKNGAEPVGISIAIDSRKESAENPSQIGTESSNGSGGDSPPSHDLLSLLKLSKPAQILVTHDLCERMGTFKGLPLRPFPARFGVSEYLWISEEKLELLQAEPQLTLGTVPALPPKARSEPERKKGANEIHGRDELSFGTRKLPSDEETNRDRHATLHNPKWIAVGAAALIVVAAGFWGISSAVMHSEKTKAPAQVMSEQPAAPVASSGNIATQPAHLLETPDAGRRDPAIKSAKAKVDPAANPKLAKLPQLADRSRNACQLDGSLPQYLALAENKRENAQYPEAERLFRQVLACDPSNPDAQRGLKRTLAAEEVQ